MEKEKLVHEAYLVSHVVEENGSFPNNGRLPLLIYKGAFMLKPDDTTEAIKKTFAGNGYSNSWENGIYDYHHYHATTHETMGVFCGRAEVQFGGDHGVCIELNRGDAVVIPAGVAHKCLKSSDDFLCVGAYPNGRDFDMKYGKEEERPEADEQIAAVPLPDNDPVYGSKGHLHDCWYTQA
ncbi:hypothetical protein C7T94_01650 [Pedobacter yulinensis]|uniref:Cupin type-1 domain-containing protein n=1 Tax=Pedobacter yulinensis TaxID=2126353 RepID=A0A2T3HQW9_9SPHI|nr:hypothetical protein [Pedobacter yulinensis]PST84855.1 hypothetical protein C7T94_01650 [Pedobacter yulinensis]